MLTLPGVEPQIFQPVALVATSSLALLRDLLHVKPRHYWSRSCHTVCCIDAGFDVYEKVLFRSCKYALVRLIIV
jgi:hypothetical protein